MGEKRRRGHGEGSVYQRADGRWVAVVEYPPVMGKRRRKYCYADTRREATAALRDMQRQGGTVPRDDRQTVGAYLAAWLDGYGPSVRGNTAIRHEGAIRVHLTPRLGHIRLARLAAADVQAAIADMSAAGLAPASVRLMVSTLACALRSAQAAGLVDRVVTADVHLPRVERHVVTPWTPEEIGALLRVAVGHRYEVAYVLAAGAGLRLGEIAGLAWPHVDLTARTVRVAQQLARGADGRDVLGPLKSGLAVAPLPLPSIAVDALAAHHARQTLTRDMAGAAWMTDAELARRIVPARGGPYSVDLVLRTSTGNAVTRRDIAAQLHRLAAAAGIPRRRFHDLRHAHASYLLAIGASLVEVRDALRHSKIGVTADTYTHLLPGLADANARRIDALLRGAAAAAGDQGDDPTADS